jgi:enoyl-CoA hydratase/carnithine racemase
MPGLRVSKQDRIAEVVLDRPPVNALSRETYEEIKEVFDSFRDMDDVSVVVFTGAGDRVFCGGRDIHDLKAERAQPCSANIADPMYRGREAYFAVRHCAVPVICAVNGAVVGAGVALAAASDIVLAAETATFRLAEINVGVLGAASFAQWLVGPGKARRMFYTGEPVTAAELYRLGGAEAVVPPADLPAEARALAALIATKDPVAIRMAKASVVRTDTLPLETAYRTEQDYTRHLSAYANSANAIDRFVNKG